MKDIKRLAEIQKNVQEATSEEGVTAFGWSGVHLTFKCFNILFFDSYSVKNIGGGPSEKRYELFTKFDGIRFFCLADEDEYESLTPIDDIIAEYETKLNELKKKKEVVTA